MCDSREFCRSSRDSTIGINFDALGDVEHFEHVSGDFFDLFKSGEHADVTFLISGVKFPAHRIILAARCTYFKVLLFGEMKEAHPGAEIPIQDTTPEAFGILLEYIYSGRICLGDLQEEVEWGKKGWELAEVMKPCGLIIATERYHSYGILYFIALATP